MYKVITFFLLFFTSTLYAQEPILVSAYIVDRYPAQILKVAGDYKKKATSLFDLSMGSKINREAIECLLIKGCATDK